MTLKNKNILITGISGFAGSFLSKNLLDKGLGVYGLIRRKADGTRPKNLVDRGVVDEVSLIEGSLEDITSLAFALEESQPDIIFHLAAQSYVPRSFTHPLETIDINCMGTTRLLEAVRSKDMDPKIVFAGSSEEYGLVISSDEQYEKYKPVFPEPDKIPELPVREENPLRPMSPYAVSKVYGDYIMRNYHHSYGMKTVVSRAFNHEGAGRGIMFVTSTITNQIMKLRFGEVDRLEIGDVNSFRDWSHVMDIVEGYRLLAEKGRNGDVYNQGSSRTNSVLSYILLGLESAGFGVSRIETLKGDKVVDDPIFVDKSSMFGFGFDKTLVDSMMLSGELSFEIADKGIKVYTESGPVIVEFRPERFRPAEVPILMCDNSKIGKLGFKNKYKLEDIIKSQLDYYLDAGNRL